MPRYAWRIRSLLRSFVAAFEHDAPGFQHIAAVGEVQRLRDALLDQQHGEAGSAVNRDDSARRSRPPPSAPAPSTARRASTASATTPDLLRSPASAADRRTSAPACCFRALRQHREPAVDLLQVFLPRARGRLRCKRPSADSRTPSAKGTPGGLRDMCAMPRCARADGETASRSLPSNRMLPAIGRTMPEMVLNKVVLPAPLGPTIAANSPASTRDRDAVQDGYAAVARAQALDLKHWRPSSACRDRRR